MNDSYSMECLAEHVKQNRNKERSKKALKLFAGIVLIPVTAAAFFYLPSKIADTISYHQSKKYRKKKGGEADFDGVE